MAKIAAQAVVDPRAVLADDVEVGPFCCIGPDVSIGPGTVLANNVTLTGRVTIGAGNRIHSGVVIGDAPQDLSYRGGATQVVIGDGNVIREHVTINRGSEKEDGVTSIGSQCYLMANSHVAHDCKLGSRVVIANGTLLAGHVHVHDDVTLSGNVAIHHYATVGSYSFVGGLARVTGDIPPYMLCEGSPARPRCVNVVALKRNDFSQTAIKALQEAHRLLYRGKVRLDDAREILRSGGLLVPQVNHLLSFLEIQQEGRHGRGRERLRRMAA
ncbi:MAG: acyl-ACP--UDP-N-acetylglucosamine O-acyltransferase [Planctomycetales bacterium]|nr:acyl-ACP--UDP-N-acetylglucosamine O-acyltransferase [Planctomycetales bacterium]